jgi:hypothetical protein
MKKSKDNLRDSEDVEMLDDMLSALVALLEEKGLITQEEWEKKIKQRIAGKPSRSFADLPE